MMVVEGPGALEGGTTLPEKAAGVGPPAVAGDGSKTQTRATPECLPDNVPGVRIRVPGVIGPALAPRSRPKEEASANRGIAASGDLPPGGFYP